MMISASPHLDGEQRKADAMALLAKRREIYVNRGRRALLRALLHSGTATADDVRAVVKLPPGTGPKLFGSVPGALVRAGIIRADGFGKTSRPEGHARPVTVWKLVDRAGALRWLAEHPDLPGEADYSRSDGETTDRQKELFPLH